MDNVHLTVVVGSIAVATAVQCLLAGLVRPAAGSWALLLAVAVALPFADRYLPTNQWPRVTSADAEQRVLMSAVPLAVIASVLSWRRVPWWAGAVFVPVATAAVLLWVVSAYPAPVSTDWATRLAIPAAAALAVWAIVEPLAVRRRGGVAAPLVLGCLVGGVALLNLFGVYTKPGWVAVGLGGVVAGTFLTSVTNRGPSLARGPAAVLIVLLTCLAACNRIDGEEVVPPLRWGLLLAAAAAAWIVEVPWLRIGRAWLREPIRAVVVAAVVAAAVVPAYRHFEAQQQQEMAW